MKFAIPLLIGILAVSACSESTTAPQPSGIEYPDTVMTDHTDNYHGVEVADPYRWLEDDVRNSEDVKNWVDAQNEVTFAYLKSIPERDRIKSRLTKLWDFERFGIPYKEGGRYFYSYNDGLQNQNVIYTQTSLDTAPELLLDPNTWSDDGTVALGSYFPSPDGKHVAYLVQDGGSDWRSARVLNIDSGQLLDDSLEWLKFTNVSWAQETDIECSEANPETCDPDTVLDWIQWATIAGTEIHIASHFS